MSTLNWLENKFTSLSKKEQAGVILFGLYSLYKVVSSFKKLRKICNSNHDICNNKYIQRCPDYLFPNYFENGDGLWIHFRKWTVSDPKGIIILIHGLAEHMGRYEHIAQAFNKSNYDVYGMDHQGHGNSDGNRCHVKHFKNYVLDVIQFSQKIKKEFNKYDLPMFLMGHSLGGLISISTGLYNDKNNLHLYNGGLIISSPALRAGKNVSPQPTNPIILSLLKLIAYLFPKLRIVAIDNQNLSHNPSILYHALNDPLHFTGLSTAGLGLAVLNEQDYICNNLDKITYPFYVFGGNSDKIVSVEQFNVFYNKTGTDKNNKQIRIFKGLLHECLNESKENQIEVMNSIIKYCNNRIETIVIES